MMFLNVTIAYMLDILLGDPELRIHPVRLIGGLIRFGENLFYDLKNKIMGGFLEFVFSTGIVFIVVFFISKFSALINLPYGFNPVFIILVYFLFCNRDMHRHAMGVFRALENGDIKEARRLLGKIVGRDVEILDKRGIIRATVETIAENTVDGFIAPLFYLTFFGLTGGFFYKTINTMDSMLGYRSDRYEKFGKIPARVDDVFNYIPARLNIIFLFIGSGFKPAVLRVALKNGRKHPSPNSGLAEASFSGFLGMALGGPSFYGGKEYKKPWIGKNIVDERVLEGHKLILKALFLYWLNSFIALFSLSFLMYYFNLPLFY